jgi:UDP-N-acetylglucosamine:LPS N-acetylglucosamine transferase
MADNQLANANALEKMGAIVCIGSCENTSPETYSSAFLRLGKNKLQLMSSSALKLIDTKGADRVCDYLLSEFKH